MIPKSGYRFSDKVTLQENATTRSLIRGTPAVKTAGVRRRVIEGEGLGGFARRLTY
jgi:hypothetical protein